ncbi:MAG TPA: hypothetical protein VF735_04970 [Pyrinomonadaceae bacterium]
MLEQLAVEAALGDTDAQYNLGVEFYRGDHFPRDYAKAATMWGKASTAGSVEAANNLGFLKYYGRPGVARDYSEGISLWRFAAERGFAESQVHLGQAFSDGRFLKQDFVEAYAWAMAGKHYSSKMVEIINDPRIGKEVERDAEKVLAEARTKLSRQQLAEAEKRAHEYISKYAPR